MALSKEIPDTKNAEKGENDDMFSYRQLQNPSSLTEESINCDVRVRVEDEPRDQNSSLFEGRMAIEPQSRFTELHHDYLL